MKIPIINLKKQYAPIKKEIEKKVLSLFEEQAFILGKEVEKIEEAIASYCNTKYAIGVNSGTDALILALKAIGIKAGDEVITTPFTFIATAEAINLAGARPVFVDIDSTTYNINPSFIEKSITDKTKAIIPVHLYGLCADMDSILKIAGKYHIKVIEDCAQAIGSEYKGKKAGSMGDAGAISFYPGKNLGCFGDGGMIVTNNEELYKRSLLLRNHGSPKNYYHSLIGYNSRLDNLQAAVLNVKINYLDGWLDERAQNAEFFTERFKNYPFRTPHIPRGYRHTFHHYIIRVKDRDALLNYLNEKGIEARVYYPVPLHLQDCFKNLEYTAGDFKEAEAMSRDSLAIPVYPELKQEEKEYITDALKSFFKN